jgi:hypothetical protein
MCYATVGAVSNPDHMNISLGKAGRNRWLGKRPHNRLDTMNVSVRLFERVFLPLVGTPHGVTG